MIETNSRPKVSVVIPVYNGSRTIGYAIECVLHQSLKPFEIIVVDDGSTDRTAEIIKSYGSRIVYLPKPNGGPASARNHGIRIADGDFIAFTDSDCLPEGNWLYYLLKEFKDERVGGVGGIVRSVGKNLTGQYVDFIRLLDPLTDDTGEIPYVITANACFRREALIKAGLFNERFLKPGGEEAELGYRIRLLGYRFCSTEQSLVLHHHRQSARGLLRTIGNYGEGAYVIGRLHPERSLDDPVKQFWRSLISLRSAFANFIDYLKDVHPGKAFYFSILSYLRQPAFIWGYLKGRRREL